ncbi:hypothetical protein B0H10DRAFT_2159080 [Mycena sp. CBHHK59/15]|nr:hypothetical protein B0H10DRAFT_2159080 [Mycena sp. CBHHK59/15]
MDLPSPPYSRPPETPLPSRPQPRPAYRGSAVTNTPTVPSSLSICFTPAPASTATSLFNSDAFPGPVIPPLSFSTPLAVEAAPSTPSILAPTPVAPPPMSSDLLY